MAKQKKNPLFFLYQINLIIDELECNLNQN